MLYKLYLNKAVKKKERKDKYKEWICYMVKRSTCTPPTENYCFYLPFNQLLPLGPSGRLMVFLESYINSIVSTWALRSRLEINFIDLTTCPTCVLPTWNPLMVLGPKLQFPVSYGSSLWALCSVLNCYTS